MEKASPGPSEGGEEESFEGEELGLEEASPYPSEGGEKERFEGEILGLEVNVS